LEDALWPLPNGVMPRKELLQFLRSAPLVREAVRRGRCVLCRARGVGHDALCEDCRPYLSDEERALSDALREGAV
jgi:hypothetical protein